MSDDVKSRSQMRRLLEQGAPVCWLCAAPAVTPKEWRAPRQRCQQCLNDEDGRAA